MPNWGLVRDHCFSSHDASLKQCSLPSSEFSFWGPDRIRLRVSPFGGAKTDYALESEDRMDARGLYSWNWDIRYQSGRNITPRN